MALVRLADDGDIAEQDREVAESGLAQYGQLLETWRAILRKPGLMSAYLPFLRAVAGPGVLDTRIKELTATYVGALNNCRYTLSHRAASANRQGVPEQDVVAAVSEMWDSFSERERVALDATKELTLQPSQIAYDIERSPLNADTRAGLREHFSDEELVELLMSISIWNGLARWHRVMEFELDMPAAPAAIDFAEPSDALGGTEEGSNQE